MARGEHQPGQLERARLRTKRSPVLVRSINGICDLVLRVRDESLGLLGLVCLKQILVLVAPSVADLGGLQDISEFVYLQRQGVTDPGIGEPLATDVEELALVMEGRGLAGMSKEHRVLVPAARLK
jgi:hypothetical protein